MTNYGRLLIANNQLRWSIFLSLCIASFHLCQSQDDSTNGKQPPHVETKYGTLKGRYYKTQKGREVYAFRGVPYAYPPLGEYRFQPPLPPQSWTHVREAVTSEQECIQINYPILSKGDNFISGSEDCLYLDIYTPFLYRKGVLNPAFNPSMPVLVNIHGGTIAQGKSFKPVYLLDRVDAVFVHVNYRQGPFGFLSTESGVVPGNMGLKDQVAALHWIKENIHVFNGDVSRITLIGVSAGGASVHYHYLSYMSQDLFTRGISMSGTALCPWALMERGLEKMQRLADALGCSTEVSIEDQIECLREKSAIEILEKVQDLFFPWIYSPFSPFGPTIERNTTEPFIDENPYDLIRLGKAKNAPWLTSVVSQEGLLPIGHIITNETNLKELKKDWDKIAPYILDYNYTTVPKFQTYISNEIKRTYLKDVELTFGDNDLDPINPLFQQNVIDLFSDRFSNSYCGKAAEMHAKYYTSDVYFYVFSYRGDVSVSMDLTGSDNDFGASPGDDMMYTLGAYKQMDSTSKDYEMVIKMQKVLKSFLMSGRPKFSKSKIWQPISKNCSGINFLHIVKPTRFRMVSIKNFGRFSFWMTLNIDELFSLKEDRYYGVDYEEETLIDIPDVSVKKIYIG